MKTQPIYLVVVFSVITSLAACAVLPTPANPPATPTVKRVPTWTPFPFVGRLIYDKLTSKALEGNLMGNPTEREFLVYLPPDYETSGKRYPVVYVLHGATVGNGYLATSVKSATRNLLSKGEAREMIFVFPDGSNKLVGSMYMSSITNGDFETYITKELVDRVDSTYRTIPNRDSRAITGCSMGGLGAMHLGFKYPDIYGVSVPMNGLQMYEPFNEYLWNEDVNNFSTDVSDWSTLTTSGMVWEASLAIIASPNPDKPPFYFDMPYKEENGKNIIDPVVYEKVKKLTVTNDIKAYLGQPIRLNALYIFTSNENDDDWYKKIAADFDEHLTTMGIPHDYTMFSGGHCNYDLSLAIKYLSDHLVFK